MSPEPASKKPPPLLKALSAFLKTFFHLLYGQFAWTYDWVAAIVSLGRWNSWVKAVLPYLPGPKVLELGHGPGHLQVALNRAGFVSFGMDASKQMGRLAQSNIRKAGIVPLLVNGYAQSMPFPDASLNQVVATFPTEYIFDPATVKEVYRILLPGGRLVVLLVAWITGRGLLERAAAWLFRVTKQAPPETPGSTAQSELRDALAARLVARLESTGFQTKVEFVELRSSILMIILGDKV